MRKSLIGFGVIIIWQFCSFGWAETAPVQGRSFRGEAFQGHYWLNEYQAGDISLVCLENETVQFDLPDEENVTTYEGEIMKIRQNESMIEIDAEVVNADTEKIDVMSGRTVHEEKSYEGDDFILKIEGEMTDAVKGFDVISGSISFPKVPIDHPEWFTKTTGKIILYCLKRENNAALTSQNDAATYEPV